MSTLQIIKYTENWEGRWDEFIKNSDNGTFLQTRKFLNYHPKDRFIDSSLLVLQGNNIVAAIPACDVSDCNNKKIFFSHKGSTFGGIVIDKDKYNITILNELFYLLDMYLKEEGYSSAYFKQTSNLFSNTNCELFDYFYYKSGFSTIDELSFYIDINSMPDDIYSLWSSGRRRDYRYSLKNNLEFRRLKTDSELEGFYELLKANLARHDAKPVHTLDELKEFRDIRFPEEVDFYGVFYENEIIAGSMLFYFENNVLHTQYLAQDIDHSKMFTMNFLIYNLIKTARDKGFDKLSFGISTEDHGKILNTGLAVFKEGFNAKYCNNKSYIKNY